jgi:hypothetical protein
MKKGLLSILAGALLVVGCQNYDDQFSALETQINALASTVAGLSQVQSDIASLSATVNSLQANVAATVDAALADGLADIDAAVADLEAAADNAASAEDVQSIADGVQDNADDLEELLAQSSVFTGDVTVTSQSTLDAYLAMGSGLNIVNGNVTITPSADMSQTDVQALVDNIITVVKDYSYTAPSSDYAAVIFDAITGVQTITLKQGGSYDLRNLISAEKIILNDQFKSTVTLIHLESLTQVGTIQDDNGVAGTIKFNKAEEFHLTSLPRYPGNNLNVQIKEGGVLAMGALTDLDADGTAVGNGYSLTIDGPASLDISSISDGTISLTNVATASISGFIGESDINAGVVTLNLTGAVAVNLADAGDLETATISGALDSDPNLATADTAGPAITFASQDLITATISGIVASVNATGQSNLETITVSADFKGGALTLSGNGDLVTVDVSGAKIGNVTFNDNDDMETLVLNHTTSLATTDKASSIVVTNNLNLTDLTVSADKVDVLNVSVNDQLETVDFTGLATVGTATSATVDVKQNKLTASLAKDGFQAAAATADAGSYTSSSGLKTLKTYLTAALAATTSDIEVYFDDLELVQTQASATANYVDIVHNNPTDAAGYVSTSRNAVLVSVTTAPTGSTVRETESFVWESGTNALRGYLDLSTGEGVSVTYGGVTKTWVQGTAPAIATVSDLITAINADTTFGNAITLTAARDSYAKSYNNIAYTDETGAAETLDTRGTILVALGTVTKVVTSNGTVSSAANLATAIAAAITGTVVSGTKYNAAASGTEIILTRTVTNTGYTDLGPNTAAFPTISIDLGNATFTTVDFSDNTTTNSTGANSDFFISITPTNINGLRVTVKNNSTAVALAATVTGVAGGMLATDALRAEVPTELVSGTNMPENAAYDAGFTDIADVTPAATTSVSRIGWL